MCVHISEMEGEKPTPGTPPLSVNLAVWCNSCETVNQDTSSLFHFSETFVISGKTGGKVGLGGILLQGTKKR